MTTTVELGPDQREIRDVAHRFLQTSCSSDRLREVTASGPGFDEDCWTEIAEMGWLTIGFPEEHGGHGFGTVERCVLLEEMGRVLFPSPFLASSVLASDVLLHAASPEASASLLPSLGEGVRRASVVASEIFGVPDGAGPPLMALEDGQGWTISGSGGLVIDGMAADLLIVVAPADEGAGLFAVAASVPELTRTPVALLDPTRRAAEVHFAGARAERIDADTAAGSGVREALDRATVALAAEMAGGTQRCVELTLEYVRNRKQFGVAIGSFQAVKHRCADIWIAADAAREAVYFAADVIGSGDLDQLPIAASTAKIAAGDAFVAAANAAIQLHGGIGYTWEHDAHLFQKRAVVSDRILGSAAAHRDRLARQFGL